jgi:predicted nucleotidyltransferase
MRDLDPSIVDRVTAALADRPEVLEAYVFGSQASGAATALSDVDVAVYLDTSRAPATPYGAAADLSTALGVATSRPDVDVVVLNDAPPLLYHRVITRGIRILSRDLRATTTREGQALSRYCDYQPQLRRLEAALASRLAAGTFGR